MRSWWSGLYNPLFAAFAVAGLSLGASPAAAQLEFAPSIGVFWPLGGWTLDFGGETVRRRHIVTGMLSGRVAYWPGGGRLGIEATTGIAASAVAVSDLGGTEDVPARVLLSSVRVLARVLTLTEGEAPYTISSWTFHVGAGVGLMARRGFAWANTTGTSHPAAVLALDTRTRLGGRATFRLSVEDFMSWATFNEGRPAATEPRVQHDLVSMVSIQFRLGGTR